MRKWLFLIGVFICADIVDAHTEECTMTSRAGEDCLHVENYTDRGSSGVTFYHWRMQNRCDVTISVSYLQRSFTGRMSEDVPPHGAVNATGGGFAISDSQKEGYYDFRVTDCSSSKEQGKDKKASAADKAKASVVDKPLPSVQQSDQACADYKSSCMRGCDKGYKMTSDDYSRCMDFCKSPCSNGQLRQANPYLATPATSASDSATGACSDTGSCNAGCSNMTKALGSAAGQVCQKSCTDQVAECRSSGERPSYQTAQAVVARLSAPVAPPGATILKEEPSTESAVEPDVLAKIAAAQQPTQQMPQSSSQRETASNGKHVIDCTSGVGGSSQHLLCLTEEPASNPAWYDAGMDGRGTPTVTFHGLKADTTGNQAVYERETRNNMASHHFYP